MCFPTTWSKTAASVNVLRQLIGHGLDPRQAIRCATINSAIRLRRDDLGLIAAGRRADLVTLTDLHDACDRARLRERPPRRGQRAHARDAASLPRPPPATNTMRLDPLRRDDFRVRVTGVRNGRARVRTIKGARFTSWGEIAVDVRDGFAVLPDDVSVMTVVHRHGRTDGKPQTAIIEGWERWRGAYASSYSHDSHNLVVFGHDPDEMMLAANTVIDMGGGVAVVKDGAVSAEDRLSGRRHAVAQGARPRLRASTRRWSTPPARCARGSRPTAPSRRSAARALRAIRART